MIIEPTVAILESATTHQPYLVALEVPQTTRNLKNDSNKTIELAKQSITSDQSVGHY